MRAFFLGSLVLTVLVGCGGAGTGTQATTPGGDSGLLVGGNTSNFGRHALAAGFEPDPVAVPIVSGGDIDVTQFGLGPDCKGFVTAQPDFILDYSGGSPFLRLFVVPQQNVVAMDTTLVINTASGEWVCNDDARGANPVVDLANPPGGQYDVWIGSYQPGANIQGHLGITELPAVQPDVSVDAPQR